MKLAEALQERADIQTRIDQLSHRLMNNVHIQEGEEPSENPEDLLQELQTLMGQLERLITLINKTNVSVTDASGESLNALLAKRHCLRKQMGIIRRFLDEASDLPYRTSRSEIKVRSTVHVATKQRELDALSKQYRDLDTHIQQLNWTTDIL